MNGPLRDALGSFIRAAAERDANAVRSALNKIEELHAKLGPDADPMLRHYLERRSYQKALDLLNTGRPESDKPACGH